MLTSVNVLAGKTPLQGLDLRWQTAERLVMIVALVSLGVRTTIVSAVTIGVAVSVLILPLWVSTLSRFAGARAIWAAGLAAVAGGSWLAWDTVGRHADLKYATADVLLVLGALSGIGVILWCRTKMSDALVGMWFGLGLLLNALLNPGDLTPLNPWKFGFVVPVAVIVLSIVNQAARKRQQLAVLLFLTVTCALADARSMGATFVLAAVLFAWQLRPSSMSRRSSWVWTAALIGGLGAGLYRLATALLVDGYLGAEAQARSVQQLESAGSLILGGRPEAAATLALVHDEPFGYGVGVVPNLSDVNTAKTGMFSQLGYQPDSGYVERFMFGGRIELHSTLADFWAHYGVLGVMFGLFLTYFLVRGAALQISKREASAVVLYLTFWTLWNLFFSPAYSALPTLMLVMGLILSPRVMDPDRQGLPPPPNVRLSPSGGAR